ncbi:hypothetical protein [Bradyrhizobium elkanii]|uniref:hypothetical protein n=1 Tax=Bradyrhizobium elkanii TaxID=29448 RepID=UPI00048702A3|nr:hypothetical protein [Bradyrhizobium elkanii]WLB00885.1 hypothetical protein QNJ80_02390 [Bradyrhizobium elkanii]
MATAQVLGLVVRDAPQAALLTMRVYYCAAKQDLILRSPPKAGVSKDGHEGIATICDSPALAAQVLGLVVRDAPQAALLTMRVYYCAAKQDLILRSPPKAGVSRDGHEGTATKCDSPALAGEAKELTSPPW